MCGRFTLTYAVAQRLARALGVSVEDLEGWEPRFNIAPTQEHFIVVLRGEDRQVLPARWGLLNDWIRDPKDATKTFNARAETLAERPAFRAAFEQRRCVVPADGFYEWQGHRESRRPYWFHRRDGGLLLFAGLYEHWQPRGGPPAWTFTIVTTEAKGRLAEFHDRMPVILDDAAADDWMYAKTGEHRLRELIRSASGDLEARPVSQAVNRVENEGPSLLEPAAEQVRLF